jgi:ethanolamine ammonia-lyase small subunit
MTEGDSSKILKKDCHPERSAGRVVEGSALTNVCHPERSETQSSEVEGPTPGAGLDQSPSPDLNPHPLAPLRQFTPARIALERTGDSLPTRDLLDFSFAHAQARDAVHAQLDTRSITEQLSAANLESLLVHSAATDRATYLRRTDLGRTLDETSRELLAKLKLSALPEIVFIVADGLSAIAPQNYAVAVIRATLSHLQAWRIGPVVVAQQARVALGDEIGEILQAEMVVMLIGERPGLSASDSLGIYLTYAPKPGRTDAERNCISNVRHEGTSPHQAAQTLYYLLTNARLLKLSGVGLKDESGLLLHTLPRGQDSGKLL